MLPSFEKQYQSIFTAPDPAGKKRKRVIDDPYLHRFQRRHFLLFDVGPAIGTGVAIALLPFYPIGWTEITLFWVMWMLSGFGISAGYHRLFAHKSFRAKPSVRVALAICGSMAGQGGVLSWVAMHRRHHECGDAEGDMHSPNLHGPGVRGKIKGFIHAHFTWMMAHPYPNVSHYAPDLLRDQSMVFVSRHYYYWVLLGLIAPAVVCALVTRSWMGLLTGFLWGGMVRMFVLEHGIWSLNSFCHLVGKRCFATGDQSRNIGWLALFIFGESWHHNHHAFPGSASFGLAWYRVDPGFWLIRLLELCGLSEDVKVPPRDHIRLRMKQRA